MYPKVKDPSMVGEYSPHAYAGGGIFWDEVLEYRVWCHPDASGDYYYPFEFAEVALAFSRQESRAEKPLALVLQKEYVNEKQPGVFIHMKEERITEWPLEFLAKPRRSDNSIPDFMARKSK